MNNKLHIAYGDVYLDWKLGENHPTNPKRAKYAVELIKEDRDFVLVSPDIVPSDRDRLESIHDKKFVSRVIDEGVCAEWDEPVSKKLGQVATHMFAGTVRLVEKMLEDNVRVAFNPQGAKHHAQYNRSSGFCVFNDMAWAAKEFAKNGMRPMYIDWDAHHGDGVENLLASSRDIVTCSIHDGTVFPGTGLDGHKKSFGIYNWALDPGSGDDVFMQCMDEISQLADEIKPDVILLATGADAHRTDPLATLRFDYPGYEYAAKAVGHIARSYANGRVLIGGAGGYQPFDHTPQIWANVVTTVHDEVTLFDN